MRNHAPCIDLLLQEHVLKYILAIEVKVKTICLVALLYLPLITLAQPISIFLEIQTDENPSALHWTLNNLNSNQQIISDNGEIILPDYVYDWSLVGSCQDCYEIRISRSTVNPDITNANYSLKIGDDWVVYQGSFNDDTLVHVIGTCDFGNSCDNPYEIVEQNFLTQISNPEENIWHRFVPSQNGVYDIKSCANFSEEVGFLDSKVWLYEGCPDIISDGPVGAISFNDFSLECGDAAGLRLQQLNAGVEYYIRFGITNPSSVEKFKWTFIRIQDLEGCTDPASCNYNPFATIDDGSCEEVTTCGPDLMVDNDLLISSLRLDTLNVQDSCLVVEECVVEFGLREVVRFSTAIYNIGDADFIIGDPNFNEEGFSSDNCHEHWHQLGYAEYLVYAGAGQPEPVSLKNGFCMLDLGCTESVFVPKYSCNFMGITAGCFDVYSSTLPCQWVDITDMNDGNYTLVVRINWTKQRDLRGLSEQSYDNNWAQVCISIDRSSGNTVVEILDDCQPYVDCAGVPYGSLVYDCNGDCGGLAHKGDVNGDLILDSLDIKELLESVVLDDTPSATPCFDLDESGIIDLYDIALFQECIEFSKDENQEDHEHCNFHITSIDENSVVYLRLNNLNFETRTFDIEYLSETENLKGLYLELSGVSISNVNVVNENIFEYKYFSNSEIILLSKNKFLPFNFTFAKLMTVSFSDSNDNELCISDFWNSINVDFSRTLTEVMGDCIDLTVSTIDNQLNKASVFPNPVNSMLNLRSTNKIESAYLFNPDGSLIYSNEAINNEFYSIKTESFPSGIYLLKLYIKGNTLQHKLISILQ